MVGPSSSHTAGAVRIGYVARTLLGSRPVKASVGLHGSFVATGTGHGTDRALIAGLLGMRPDDMRIPESFQVAERKVSILFSKKSEFRELIPIRRLFTQREKTEERYGFRHLLWEEEE